MADPVVTVGGLDPAIISEIANANFKVVAGQQAVGLARQSTMMGDDAISHQRVINGIREAVFGAIAKGITKVDVETAMAETKLLTSDLAQKIAELDAAVSNGAIQMGQIVAMLQQLMKGAQSTPPETATGPIPVKVVP
jgi:hypothetical protein